MGPHRAAPVAQRQVVAFDAVSLHEMYRALGEALTGPTGAKERGQAVAVENISETVIRITGDPAVALGDMASGIDGEKLVGAVLSPDARQRGVAMGEVIHQLVERADAHVVMAVALEPDIGQLAVEPGQLRERPGPCHA